MTEQLKAAALLAMAHINWREFGSCRTEGHDGPPPTAAQAFDALRAALAAPAAHPDDLAVDAFAQAMKAKLAAAREKGRGGWQECPPSDLSRMLREHIGKGDPRDVANFCMFLHHLGAALAADAVPTESVAKQSWEHAGYFYNLVAHALMDVGAAHGGCKFRLQSILEELAPLAAAPQPASSVQALRQAFRTTTACGGEHPSYTMTFKFESMEQMHAADDEWRAIARAPQPASEPERYAVMEAIRQALNKLPRYSFWLGDPPSVRKAHDKYGAWIEWQAAHELFDAEVLDNLLQPASEPQPCTAKRPDFAAAVAQRKWDELKADGWCMQRIEFERPGSASAGAIDPWGVVTWKHQEPEPQPSTEGGGA